MPLRPSISLPQCNDALLPKSGTLWPEGQRSIIGSTNDQISWQAMNGEVIDGARFRISANNITFAARGNAYPTLLDDGDSQIYNGAPNSYFLNKNSGFIVVPSNIDANSPWEKPSTGASVTLIDRTVNRYPGQGFTYAIGQTDDSSCFLGWHKTLGLSHSINGNDFYFSWHMKNTSPYFAHRYYGFGNKTGTFTYASDPYGVGEAITFTASNALTATGFVIAVRSDGSIEYVLSDSPPQVGGVITGVSSGATCTVTSMSTTFLSSSSNKVVRIWNGDENLNDRYRFLSWSSDLCDGPDSISGNHFNNTSFMEVDTWGFFEVTIRCLDRANRIFRTMTKVNGKIFHDMTGVKADIESASLYSLACALVGKDPNQPTKSKMWISSLVMDTSLPRVILTNNSNYSLSTKFELQYLVSYSSTQLEGNFKFGELGNTGAVYAHIFNDFNPVATIQVRM